MRREGGRVAIAAVVLATLVACTTHPDPGPVKSPPQRPRRAQVAAAPGAPGVPWSKKSHDERLEFMGLFVFPKMKTLFSAHDPKLRFRCQTCHGEDMVQAKFAMPRALPALPADDPVRAAFEKDEKTARFMVEKVVPAMKDLLGKDDPAVEARVACFTCHPMDRSVPAPTRVLPEGGAQTP